MPIILTLRRLGRRLSNLKLVWIAQKWKPSQGCIARLYLKRGRRGKRKEREGRGGKVCLSTQMQSHSVASTPKTVWHPYDKSNPS